MIKEFLIYSFGYGIGALIWMSVAFVGVKVFTAIRRELRSY